MRHRALRGFVGGIVGGVAAVALLAGCTSVTAGKATKAVDPAGTDDAVVALLETGPYPIAAGKPFPNAGTQGGDSGTLLEAQRMAEHVTGPWQVDATLRDRGDVMLTSLTLPMGSIELLKSAKSLPEPLPDVAATHGFVAAFSTYRVSEPSASQRIELFNMVIRFADDGAATAAAIEFAEQNPAPYQGTPREPVSIMESPEALATTYNDSSGAEVVESFAAHGSFVFCQRTRAARSFGGLDTGAAVLLQGLLGAQKKNIDSFVPTPLDKLNELPLDPTGQLLARTLWAPDNSAPANIGAWPSTSWLHFERDPITASTLFRDAGVDFVSQRLGTVYRARDAGSAAKVADGLAA